MVAAAPILPVLLLFTLVRSNMSAQDSMPSPAATASSPVINADPIRVSGNTVYRWQIGDADASLLQGDCLLRHDGRRIAADSILMVTHGNAGDVTCRVVLGGAILAEGPSSDPITMVVRTLADPQIQAPIYRGVPGQPPALLAHLPNRQEAQTGPTRRTAAVTTASAVSGDPTPSSVTTTQFAEPLVTPPQAGAPPIVFSDGATTGGMQFIVGGGTRSLQILARGASTPPDFETINRADTNESAFVFRGGVTVLIRDVSARLPNGEFMELGTISLSADRIVGWFPFVPNLLNGMANLSDSEGEMYLEGDIVFRQGERIIYAESMYFNAAREVGMILDAEAITTVPNYQGVVRLKSKVLQQINRGNFRAFDAAVTTSRIGVPRYWLQSEELKLTDRQRLEVDPATGIQQTVRDPRIESNNNFVYVGGVPILYWPTFSASLDQPGYYITGASVGNDSNFGTRVALDFDLFQLFGVDNAPSGVDWELSTDYLSDRGPAIGTSLDYTLPGLFGVAGPVKGNFDAWGIHDTGLDNLGSDRRNLEPEKTNRGRRAVAASSLPAQ